MQNDGLKKRPYGAASARPPSAALWGRDAGCAPAARQTAAAPPFFGESSFFSVIIPKKCRFFAIRANGGTAARSRRTMQDGAQHHSPHGGSDKKPTAKKFTKYLAAKEVPRHEPPQNGPHVRCGCARARTSVGMGVANHAVCIYSCIKCHTKRLVDTNPCHANAQTTPEKTLR